MVHIEVLANSARSDVELVITLTNLVNEAYEQAERGLWRPGISRTTREETERAISLGEVAVASIDGHVAGAVRTRLLDTGTAWFGALAVDATFAGRGVGSQLVTFVELRAGSTGASVMQLEVLTPQTVHPHVDWLSRWYRSLGYLDAEQRPLSEVEPSAVPFLVAPCDVTVMRKQIVGTLAS